MPKIHEIIAMQMLDDDWFRSSMSEALAAAGYPVDLPSRRPAQEELPLPYTTPPQELLAPSAWRMLVDDDLIQDGDQWAPLKEPDRWRPVGDSVGTRPSNWTKSHFRRKVGVEQMAVAERVIAQERGFPGSSYGTRAVEWHVIQMVVGRLVWVKDNGDRSNARREIAIIKSVNGQNSITIKTMSGEKTVNTPFELFTLDHDEQWMIGMRCAIQDSPFNEFDSGRRDILTRITSGSYKFDDNWMFCCIDEAYYTEAINRACAHSSVTPDALEYRCIVAGQPVHGADIGDLVWIGDGDDRKIAIFRGLLTGEMVFSFDTENGVASAPSFVKLEDAPKWWLVGFMCNISDYPNGIWVDEPKRINEYDPSRSDSFRHQMWWKFAKIAESHYYAVINDAMANIAQLQEAPF
ncbi:MAG: hypothetical protein IPM06_18715 [Rhizobiales bacterium]|nr:hypothetical protein [Hyphomicrobiales bacterium]